MKPRETRQFYVKRLEELGEPEWRRQSHEGQEDGAQRPWCCPDCGEKTANTKATIKAHRRVCPAKEKEINSNCSRAALSFA